MRDSDGYIIIDLGAADITKSTQNIPGIFDRIQKVIDTNKLVLVINFGDYSPMPAIAHKKLNYYVITTNLFIITINSNNVVVIEESGETTVDVSIVPTLLEGVKIADYAIGEVEGSIYAPEQVDVINDNVTAENTTWSSDKIDDELDTKADASSLAAVATSGSYNDLTNKPTLATVATSGSYNDLTDKPSIPDELNDLSDVTLTSPSNGQTLVYDGTKFVNQTPPSGVTTLAGLTDVTLTTPASGNALSYDGSKWVNSNIDSNNVSYGTGSVKDKLDSLFGLFLIRTYRATKTVTGNGVVALLGSDMGYNSIPTGYTPIAFTFACTNSNDLFFNLNNIESVGGSQFGVIRNVSSGAQTDKICNITITFVKTSYL